jgi:hypothetical protein
VPDIRHRARSCLPRWGDADTDTEKSVIEVNYGFALGHAAALKRIVSA